MAVRGNDTLHGGDGEDELPGGEGDDTLIGEQGNDELTGGTGKDIFVFKSDSGHDSITDFDSQSDSLLLEGADYDSLEIAHLGGNTIISFGDTQITFEDSNLTKDEIWARVLTEMPK